MGLTIHYTLQLDGDHTLADVEALTAQVRDFALRQAVLEVTPLIRVEPDFIMGIHWLPLPGAKDDEATHAEVPPQDGWMFSVNPGEGSEWLLTGLCRYPATIQYRGQVLPTQVGQGWRLQFFCKTQYASVHGWGNFLHCHRTVIDLLRFWSTLGVQVGITDEGGYWPGCSESMLWEKLDEMNGLCAAFAGALKDTTNADGKSILTDAPILKHPRFEHLEHAGVQRYGHKIAQAVRTIRQDRNPPSANKT